MGCVQQVGGSCDGETRRERRRRTSRGMEKALIQLTDQGTDKPTKLMKEVEDRRTERLTTTGKCRRRGRLSNQKQVRQPDGHRILPTNQPTIQTALCQCCVCTLLVHRHHHGQKGMRQHHAPDQRAAHKASTSPTHRLTDSSQPHHFICSQSGHAQRAAFDRSIYGINCCSPEALTSAGGFGWLAGWLDGCLI
ncbi:hypothetical protein BC567DRAFT_231108, partial [Phyllosticta citribraziliensis]